MKVRFISYDKRPKGVALQIQKEEWINDSSDEVLEFKKKFPTMNNKHAPEYDAVNKALMRGHKFFVSKEDKSWFYFLVEKESSVVGIELMNLWLKSRPIFITAITVILTTFLTAFFTTMLRSYVFPDHTTPIIIVESSRNFP
jgi:hypothetical protein